MNIELNIIWYNHEIVGFWFGQKLIWASEFKNVKGEELKKTTILLPTTEAIKFSLLFINGMSANRLTLLAITIQAKINELKKMSIEINKPILKNTCNGDCNNCKEYEKCDDEITQLTNAEFMPEIEEEEGWD